MPTALIVDDEEDIRDLISFNLQQESWDVLEAENGLRGLELARLNRPDIIVLDLMLPEMDGRTVYENLRKDSRTAGIPIIMVTAKGKESDRIEGLELGADDYVTKPFSPKELVLRMRNHLKRMQQLRGGGDIKAGPFSLDRNTLKFYLHEDPIELTSTEFKLLLILIENEGKDQSRGDLLQRIWGYDERIQTRTLDTHVKRLREKLGTHGDCVETVRGVGYRFRLPADSE